MPFSVIRMLFSLTCPACAVTLKAPDNAAGRTLRCPKCKGPVVVPAADFSFDTSHTGGASSSDDEDNPFDDQGPADAPTDRPKGRKASTKKKPTGGYNPFDADADAGAAEPQPAKKRRYRKDGDYNPFGDAPDAEEPDPVGDGFEFGLEVPPAAPTSDFDFGPQHPRRDIDSDDP